MPFKKNTPRGPQQPADAKRIFVGRTDQVRFFIRNILEPEDPSHNIVSISGQGGVGKSTLVNRFIDEAHATNFKEYCLTALVNERQLTPASVMERFADVLKEEGYPLKKFEEALTHYKDALRRMQAGHSDEQEIIVREAVDLAGTMMENIPFAGAVAHKGVNTLTGLLLEKGRTHQMLIDAARLEDPIGDLTKAFVKDLNQLADFLVSVTGSRMKHQRRILLFFDTFEQLAADIAPWLLDHFLEAEVSSNIVLVIAGRDSVENSLPDDPKRWLPLLDGGTIFLMSLNAFTEEEMRTYLAERGITDPERIKAIRHLSRGLPLYLSMLTSNPQGRIDPTAEVVENFLRWIPRNESLKRQLALNASLFSRPFNQDDLAAFSYSEPERSTLYAWIIAQPFVQSNPQDGRHSYHDLARDMFSRHLYQRSLEECCAARKALANHYQKQLTKLQAEGGKDIYKSRSWQELVLALIQQLFLLPDEESHLMGVEYTLRAREHAPSNEELIKVLRSLFSPELGNQAITNAQQITEKLVQYIEGDATDQSQKQLAAAHYLLERITQVSSFPSEVLAYVYRFRGRIYRIRNEYQLALPDYDRALTLAPNYELAYQGRGETHRLLEDYRQALADFDQAIALDPADKGTWGRRGATYYSLGEYQHALTDLDRAIALDEKDSWVLGVRGQTYRLMKRYEEALADYGRAIALDEKDAAALALRGETYRQLNRYQEALADFDRALALDEKYAGALAHRGETYRLLERYEEALTNFDRAIALDEKDAWALGSRGQTYRLVKRYQEALSDFDRALALDETRAWIFANRGETYRLLERYEEALTDFDRAIALDEKGVWILGSRGQTYRQMKRYEEALLDFDRALALDKTQAWIVAERGETYRLLARYEEALADLDHALALDEKNDWTWYRRSLIHLLTEQKDSFDADLHMAIKGALMGLKDIPEGTSEHYRISSNLVLYYLVGGSLEDAETGYDRLLSTCSFIATLQDAANDVRDFLTVQPTHEFAQRILEKIQARIGELSQGASS